MTGQSALHRLRQLCLGLPETSETDSWGHPNFRAGKRTFAAFESIKGRPSIAIRVGVDAADSLLLQRRNLFSTPYGRGQWISIWVDDELDWAFLRELVERSYRQVALKRMLAAMDRSERRTEGTS